MKKSILFTVTFLAVILFTVPVIAQSTGTSNDQKKQVVNTGKNYTPGVFVDKDNNGVCDNYESRGNVGRGRNFVDSDGDGICDNRISKGGKNWGKGNGCRNGHGNRHRGNHGNGYGCYWRNPEY